MLIVALPALVLWYLIYRQLLPFAGYFTYKVLGLSQGTALAESVRFFVYDTPKVMMLLTLIVFVVGVIRSFFTPAATRKVLAGRGEFIANVMAAGLGVVTPFCSCSAVPLFLGFVQAGVPLGVTFSFLIAAPMVNEIALVLLYGLLGWRIALIYAISGLVIAVLAGRVIGWLGLEHLVEDWVCQMQKEGDEEQIARMNWGDRLMSGCQAVREIVGRVWPFVVGGIAVGALIHGYVPENFMARIMGDGNWWSVPGAVLVGIPMYANAAGIVPVVEALLGKGAALGTVLAFMMSVIALSLPEMIILRRVLKPRMILVFIVVVGSGILFTGYLFNFIL